jgi:hypothetical protein
MQRQSSLDEQKQIQPLSSLKAQRAASNKTEKEQTVERATLLVCVSELFMIFAFEVCALPETL